MKKLLTAILLPAVVALLYGVFPAPVRALALVMAGREEISYPIGTPAMPPPAIATGVYLAAYLGLICVTSVAVAGGCVVVRVLVRQGVGEV